jgi:hypothetical protein
VRDNGWGRRLISLQGGDSKKWPAYDRSSWVNEQVYFGEMALGGCPAVISHVRQGARLNVPSGRIVGLDRTARTGEPLQDLPAGVSLFGCASPFDLAVECGLLTEEVGPAR